jgi:hypothetical protein
MENHSHKLVPEEQELANALLVIANKYGKFDADNTGIWAGYTPASENQDNAKIGVKCGNCVFFNAPNGCQIIVAEVEDGGLCRFAVLPDGAVTPEDKSIEEIFSKPPQLIQEELKGKIEELGDDYLEEYLEIDDLVPTQDYLDPENFKDAKSFTKPITVYKDEEGYKLVDGHHRCASKVMDGQRGIKAKVYSGPIVATAGSKPAPKKDRIKGSKKNPKGSAGSGKGVTFTDSITKSLEKKVTEHNEKAPNGRKVTLAKLKAVYRRGAGAFSSSHRPDQNRSSWAMARVNAFLHLVKTGKPKNSKYTTDNDLLPKMHPRSSEASTMSPLMASLLTGFNIEDDLKDSEDLYEPWLS